jgi:hypothetical protein
MSDVLQLFGGLFELSGLVAVGLGIVETRRAFTDRPGIVQKVAHTVAGFVARLTRKRGRTINLRGVALEGSTSMTARASLRYGFKGSVGERVERLQAIAQQHEERLDEIAELVRSRSDELSAEIRSLQVALSESEQKLRERIGEAAANGLTLESWGVLFFIIGVALTTWGGLIA